LHDVPHWASKAPLPMVWKSHRCDLLMMMRPVRICEAKVCLRRNTGTAVQHHPQRRRKRLEVTQLRPAPVYEVRQSQHPPTFTQVSGLYPAIVN
jgi:hypothetical protein